MKTHFTPDNHWTATCGIKVTRRTLTTGGAQPVTCARCEARLKKQEWERALKVTA